jgi:hypothetical protein
MGEAHSQEAFRANQTAKLGDCAKQPRVASRTPAKTLDPGIKSIAQLRFGHDFSHVKVHADEAAAQLHHARAFTIGSHIVFGRGEYRPQCPAGQRLIGHELAHVVQQSRGGGAPPAQQEGRIEAAADRAAAQFMVGPVQDVGSSGVGIARKAAATVDVSKLGADALEARAQSISGWFYDHLPDDPEYQEQLSAAADVYRQMQTLRGAAVTDLEIESLRTAMFERSPRTDFDRRFRRGEFPAYRVVEANGAVVGFKRSSSGYWEIRDLDGKFVQSGEIPLGTPLIDPIDLIPTGLLGAIVAKAGSIAVRLAAKAAVKVAARWAAKEGAKVVAKEGAKVVAKEGAKVVAKEGAKVIAKEGAAVAGKEGAAVAGKEGAAVAGKEGAAVAGKEGAAVAVKEGDVVAKAIDDMLSASASAKNPGERMLTAAGQLSGTDGLSAAQKLAAMRGFFNKIGFAISFKKGVAGVVDEAGRILIYSEDEKYVFSFLKDTGKILYGKIDLTTGKYLWRPL